MANYKFYNIQLLPIDSKNVKEVGYEGYCRLFESLNDQIKECGKNKQKLSSIAVSMRGGMFFAPFSVSVHEYPDKDGSKKVIYGSFLKFDDVNELVDTNSGETEYRSKGNTSSKRFNLEFVFDPYAHILAIHETKGLPTRKPLILALKKILDSHAKKYFKNHNLEVEELTSADSIKDFFESPKKGYRHYEGHVTFSNSDSFDDVIEKEIIRQAEQEMKDKNVARWESNYKSFPNSLMIDLPQQAKIQIILATKYGNAEVSYMDEDGKAQRYQMEDYPVKESLKKTHKMGSREKAILIKDLIFSAINKTKMKINIIKKNKSVLGDD
ncbi:hypothetical protein Ppb6_01211 [Photorhabdus australis subsp. thailandensis]|uniref:DUF4747 domain-containing protein n=1 Tax=Photorhabdus australis subsp. thailandensis TaxID=2805096 RepID=A0A1C0U6R7_9GAMM|nr:DUF4747 family protein [Photorhabdus australis]OCQ53585.1 hypothetical protein Ppb6_01211 [Photorhabdus australis subsp. thailandensis]